ncbi:TetR/AcrR family transcriptional regulator [Saprospira sp. CCB-QB6]|uniref:TetR/AcrR family transcriptional regulator n=1 Tax=Saprospira sp. CCB-QB6 TaxID=3023936 RepID=UPI00234A8445|nr:TetR/AcrR family transcriptional regulator [Saprospira sp. CCB-QB6]WCL80226.1 TetR/AcrR family transcriptional regulator [Saprospira sp. CCB-QB6]
MKKKRKELILAKALALFNDRGLAVISLRQIAEEMGISLGNLTYHFPKREQLVQALYYALVEELNAMAFAPAMQEAEGVLAFKSLLEQMYQLFWKYRFFLLDFRQILQAESKLKAHYQELMQQRRQQFFAFLEQLDAAGQLKKEELAGEYASLYRRLQRLSDFFLAALEIENYTVAEGQKEFVRDQVFALYPYLLGESRGQAREILEGLG